MTQDEIIVMAVAAGFGPAAAWPESRPPFIRFAELVAAREPEGGDVPKTALEGWQPIETAPVATRLMFWWRPIKPNPYAECCVIGNLCYQYETGQRNGKWWNDALGGEQDIWHLTHWMPLPAAPKP